MNATVSPQDARFPVVSHVSFSFKWNPVQKLCSHMWFHPQKPNSSQRVKNNLSLILHKHHLPSTNSAFTIPARSLDSLHVTCRYTSRDARLLYLDPAIAGVILHEDKALAFGHGVLCVSLGCVLVQCLYVAELLCAALGRHCGTLLLGRLGEGGCCGCRICG